MKLVIDIPEELYTYIQSESYDEHLDRRFDYRIRFAVRDATPLPKGHDRLIESDKLIEKIKPLISNKAIIEAINTIITFSPTVIEADSEVSE